MPIFLHLFITIIMVVLSLLYYLMFKVTCSHQLGNIVVKKVDGNIHKQCVCVCVLQYSIL